MIRFVRNYLLGLRASRLLGRAYRLSRTGRKEEAMAYTRRILTMLRDPGVDRTHFAVVTGIVCATMELEELAHDLGQPGADIADLTDAVTNLKELKGTLSPEYSEWIPFLESRLNQRGSSAA